MTDKNDKRELYNVVVTFTAPHEGGFTIAARDEDHAKEIVNETLGIYGYKDLKIIDVYALKDVETNEIEEVDPFGSPIPEKKGTLN